MSSKKISARVCDRIDDFKFQFLDESSGRGDFTQPNSLQEHVP